MASREKLIPRPGKPSTGIRENRAPLGRSPGPAETPAAAPTRLARPAAARTSAKAIEPKAPATKASATRPRPGGTSRVAVDVPVDLAQQFRDRARVSPFRFSQAEALTGALTLLADLDQDAYEELLLRIRQ